MAKRANRKTNPLGLPAFNLPNGTIYNPTANSGAQGSFAATNPVNFGSAGSGTLTNQQLEQQRVQQLMLQQRGFQTPTSTTAFIKPITTQFSSPTSTPNLPNVNYTGFQTPTTNGFVTPGYTNLTPSQAQPIVQPSTGFQTPTSTTAFNQPLSNQPVVRPEGVYTGNPNDPNTAAWKAYWNAAAENPASVPQTENAPRVMTRSEIWDMKAQSRRRRMAQEGGGGVAVSPKQERAQWASSYYSTMINTGGG